MTAPTPRRQLPKNVRTIAAMTAAVPLLVIVAACSQEPARLAASGSLTSTTTTTTSTTTTTTPPPVTVASVVDGRTVTLSDGTNVQVPGLAPPGECWAASATEFATKTLVGKTVSVVGSRLVLADGKDFGVLAASQGVARAVTGADTAIRDAEAVARQTAVGFWGPSCGGLDVKPAPQPVVPQPQPVVPQPQPQPQPAPQPPAAAYYANCAAARAAGVAPLHRGEPGYRSGLDRDNDGIACE